LDRNRHVVKEGMAKVAGKESYLILFNDVLAFTRKKKDKFDVKAVIQLKGKKWAFLTVVPSFKTSGSTIRKKYARALPQPHAHDRTRTAARTCTQVAVCAAAQGHERSGVGHDPRGGFRGLALWLSHHHSVRVRRGRAIAREQPRGVRGPDQLRAAVLASLHAFAGVVIIVLLCAVARVVLIGVNGSNVVTALVKPSVVVGWALNAVTAFAHKGCQQW
jgi:hypothetical protein